MSHRRKAPQEPHRPKPDIRPAETPPKGQAMIQRYDLEVHDPFDDILYPEDTGRVCKWEDVAPLLEELRRLRQFVDNVNEALNSGDGSYRP